MRLKKIDLRKAKEHNHPDIKVGKTNYLAKIGGELVVGQFTCQWYGLSLDNVQFDAPGYNSSEWEGLWEIVGR